jgi:hypothetical protein
MLGGGIMTTDYRPDVLGTPGSEPHRADPQAAIEKMESELKEMAVALRKQRLDYVSGRISDEAFQKIEARFMEKLVEQRNSLQLLRSAALKK